MDELVQMDDSYGRGKQSSKIYRVPVVFDKDEDRKRKIDSIEDDTIMCDDDNGVNNERQTATYACIIGEKGNHTKKLENELKSLDLQVCYSTDGRHMPDYVPDECNIVFVCPEFEGNVFEYLMRRKYRIVGPPCVYTCCQMKKPLLDRKRPLYSFTMEGVIVCLTGFRDKQRVHDLCNMIHWMGGSVRNKISTAVTHVVAFNVTGTKYKNAVSFGINIMRDEWVTKSWERRNDLGMSAMDSDLMVYKQVPFIGCHLSLFGFSDTEATHVREIAETNGAVSVNVDDPAITHLLVANGVDPLSIPSSLPPRVHIVKQQWFWESIKIEACADESLYYAKECRRKRHSLGNASSFISLDSLLEASLVSLSSPINRPSVKDPDVAPRKPSGLTITTNGTPCTPTGTTGGNPSSGNHGNNKANIARHHIASELMQTEKNFVKILNLVVNEFMKPLEQPTQRGGAVLDQNEIQSIFGSIPDILGVHMKIMSGLEERIAGWNINTCIGDVLLQQADGLLRVYPPFVNFYELTKESLIRLDKQCPRFHAFLKANESRPECGRQTLSELLITPIQRIPRIILLLEDLLKHTDDTHDDHKSLMNAIEALKKVMTAINEDKRKTEGQVHMFEIVKDIEECPANILSSNRSFLSSHELTELTSITGKGSKTLTTTFFLFSDSMEITKKRGTHGFRGPSKPYRHLEFLSYSHIRSIVDFIDNEEVTNGIGLLVRWPAEPRESLLAFTVNGGSTAKTDLINQLSELVAQTNCSMSTDDFIWHTSGDILDSLPKPHLPIDEITVPTTNTTNNNTLKKAIRGGFKGMRKKVKRTISSRSTRRPFTPLSNSTSFVDPMEEESFECDTPLNTSNSSIAPYTITPVSVLRVPSAKRPALSSMSTMDLTKISKD